MYGYIDRLSYLFHCQTEDTEIKAVKNCRYIQFSIEAGISVISVIHLANGISERKSRFSKSSDFMASMISLCNPVGFLLGRWFKPICSITRYTVRSLGICTPSGCFPATMPGTSDPAIVSLHSSSRRFLSWHLQDPVLPGAVFVCEIFRSLGG